MKRGKAQQRLPALGAPPPPPRGTTRQLPAGGAAQKAGEPEIVVIINPCCHLRTQGSCRLAFFYLVQRWLSHIVIVVKEKPGKDKKVPGTTDVRTPLLYEQ